MSLNNDILYNSVITRETAICLFFCVTYDPVVAKDYLNCMDQTGILDICYQNSEYYKPMLLPKQKIFANRTKYSLYQRQDSL